ncbi:peroxiredoxin [Pseudomethylobacillus aquaticus]|uniref:thioredoxin-dependent peroxiredoxin n=1 Tax=Pseudomethylobacillus aquaticus TaxID=2676064 RepID=A0A3N0V6M3_9PROT|nr:peroxiredoxin [Pseudomethylobacillus aquaticus]ROH88335.1 peroxiredoxin [Pseudomethylobacillus aquaticus]
MKLLAMFIITLLALAAYRYAAAASVPVAGQQAPDFKLLDSKSQPHQLNDYAGGWLVLYFYPKDDTPGCTEQACKFRDDLFALEKLGAKVVGISVDDSASHAKFAEKYNLPFPLLADKDGKVADSYGALRNLGVIKIAKRYTFLINPAGKVAKAYLSVNTSRHSQEIIDDLKKLSGR